MSQQQEHTVRTDDGGQLQTELRQLAQEIAASLSDLDAASGRALVSDFVSELFFQLAEQQRREDRRQKQAQGIAAAKARGVRFGRTAKPVPDGFDQLHRAWREGRISLKKAAESCGMTRGTFYNVALRREQQEDSRAV
jgi:DNA invertase Pin-like site-specific DNA recombinase